MLVVTRGGWVIACSLAIALVLAIVPLPEWAQEVRPEWPLLVLVYWWMALPHRIGVGIGWLVGICVDVLTGTLLGEHALGYVVVGYLVLKLYQRIRVYPPWQQAVVLLCLLGFNQLLRLWVLGMTDRTPDSVTLYLVPSLIGMVLWPWLFGLLRASRRRFQVN